MAKKKNYYYVLVFTNEGPVYVTKVDNANRYSYWNKEDKPLELGASYAEELMRGLNLNFHSCVVVKSPIEIEGHPYNYEDFNCEFTRKEEQE